MLYTRLIVLSTLIASTLSCTVGCTTRPSFETVYTQVTPSTVQPNSPIPQATGEIILTVTGKVNATQEKTASSGAASDGQQRLNIAAAKIAMDRANIEALGTIEYAVEDPFEKQENTFSGVLFRDLLDLWQVSENAQQLTITALNDYQVTIPITLLREYPVLMAMQQNGQTMTRDYRGPAMLVAPINAYPSVRALANREYWIWQIKTIHVE